VAPRAKALIAALVLAANASAQDPASREARYDIVSLQAEAMREVPNDRLIAVVAAEASGPDPAALADSVNRAMKQALALMPEFPSVKAQSRAYHTQPLYRDGRLEGWRVSQELRLESPDFGQAARLLGRLQQTLVLRGLSIGLSTEARRAAEDVLIVEAIAAFNARAALVSEAMKAAGFRLRRLELATTAGGPPRPMALAERSVAAPALEPGSSQIVVTASGSIQLK
jgi:predicted secreted protein